MNKPNICSKINQYKSKENFSKKMAIKIALISEMESSVEEAQRKQSLSNEGQTLEQKRNTAWTINDEWQQKRENKW